MVALSDPGRPDWRFVQNGAVTLFRQKHIFLDAREHLKAAGYAVPVIECANLDRFTRGVSAALRWRDQFGYDGWSGNLDALNDGLASFPFPASGRAVLCFDGFDALAGAHADLARHTLDLVEYQARNHLVHGRILLAFVRTYDPRYRAETLGARAASWNDREWMAKKRGL